MISFDDLDPGSAEELTESVQATLASLDFGYTNFSRVSPKTFSEGSALVKRMLLLSDGLPEKRNELLEHAKKLAFATVQNRNTYGFACEVFTLLATLIELEILLNPGEYDVRAYI